MMIYVAPQYDGVSAVSLPGLNQVQEVANLQSHLLSFLEVVDVFIEKLNSLILAIDYHQAYKRES